jgi:hypothetical protein
MSEAEFQKSFPEAFRHKIYEGFWVDKKDTAFGIEGFSAWFICSDTVMKYNFTSCQLSDQSSDKFVSNVNLKKLLIGLDSIRNILNERFGKSTVIKKLVTDHKMIDDGQPFYFSEWNYGGSHYVSLDLRRDKRNKLDDDTNYEFVTYTIRLRMHVNVDYFEYRTGMDSSARIEFINRGIYVSETDFFNRFAILKSQIPNPRIHVYTQVVSKCNPGVWRFMFLNDTMESFEYESFFSVKECNLSDSMAYNLSRVEMLQLKLEGEKAFGAPEIIDNRVPLKYSEPPYYSYRMTYISLDWVLTTGIVWFSFVESVEKNSDKEFHLEIKYERSDTSELLEK